MAQNPNDRNRWGELARRPMQQTCLEKPTTSKRKLERSSSAKTVRTAYMDQACAAFQNAGARAGLTWGEKSLTRAQHLRRVSKRAGAGLRVLGHTPATMRCLRKRIWICRRRRHGNLQTTLQTRSASLRNVHRLDRFMPNGRTSPTSTFARCQSKKGGRRLSEPERCAAGGGRRAASGRRGNSRD